MKVVAMYLLLSTDDKPALVGLFSDMRKANAYLVDKDKRKYYVREYTVDALGSHQ